MTRRTPTAARLRWRQRPSPPTEPTRTDPAIRPIVDELSAGIDRPAPLVVEGPAGSGRTSALRALAGEAARRGVPVCMPVLPTSPTPSPAELVNAVAWALRTRTGALSGPAADPPGRSGSPVSALVTGWLQGQRGLLLLDDLDRFTGAPGVVGALLTDLAIPGCLVVGTWRAAVAGTWPPGVRVVRLGPPDPKQAVAAAEAVLGARLDGDLARELATSAGADPASVRELAAALWRSGRVATADGHALLRTGRPKPGGPGLERLWAAGSWEPLLARARADRVAGRHDGAGRWATAEVLVQTGQLGRARRWLAETAADGPAHPADGWGAAADLTPDAALGRPVTPPAPSGGRAGAAALVKVLEAGLRAGTLGREEADRSARALERIAADTGDLRVRALSTWAAVAVGGERCRAAAAVRAARRLGHPYRLARACLVAAPVDEDPAARLAEAFELFAGLGADPWTVRAHALFCAVGGRPGTTMALTAVAARRRVVHRAVADGLGNREIALLTGTTRKRVERTVSELLAGTGCANRTALAAHPVAGTDR